MLNFDLGHSWVTWIAGTIFWVFLLKLCWEDPGQPFIVWRHYQVRTLPVLCVFRRTSTLAGRNINSSQSCVRSSVCSTCSFLVILSSASGSFFMPINSSVLAKDSKRQLCRLLELSHFVKLTVLLKITATLALLNSKLISAQITGLCLGSPCPC